MPLRDIAPRHLHGCIAYRHLLSSEGAMPMTHARRILTGDGFEAHRSLELLIQHGMVGVSNDIVEIDRPDIDGIDIRREIILGYSKQHRKFALKLQRIGPVPRSTRGVENLAQMVREAELFHETDLAVMRWWSNLRSINRRDNTQSDENLDETGLIGEYFTMEYERRRLGVNTPIRWVSRWEGDYFGYDIESFEEDDLQESRFIEVKSSSCSINNALVYLTFNEYEQLIRLGDAYYLYLWPEVENRLENEPIIIGGNRVAEVLHQLNPNIVRWDGAVIIPFQELV